MANLQRRIEILCNAAESGDIHEMTWDGGPIWVRAGKADLGEEKDRGDQALYVDELRSMVSDGLVERRSESYYRLSGAGFAAAKLALAGNYSELEGILPESHKKMPEDTKTHILTPEQENGLVMLVEADRRVSRNERRSFFVRTLARGGGLIYEVSHPGIVGKKTRIYPADLDELKAQDLIRYSGPDREAMFDVTAAGFKTYEDIKKQAGQPLVKVENSIKGYLDDASFQLRHKEAYRKLVQASELLNSSDAEQRLTQIGHDCREAMQQFATDLVEKYRPENVDPDKAHTVARIQKVLAQRQSRIDTTYQAFLASLVPFWGTVSDLVQRQEHGALREGAPLGWEDARRVVFYTGIVMHELDKAMSHIPATRSG